MIFQNNKSKARKLHYWVNGVPFSKTIGGYQTLSIPEITHTSQINWDSHDAAILVSEENIGVELIPSLRNFCR